MKQTANALLPRKWVANHRYQRAPKTLDRWSKDPDVNFPTPVDIRGLKYYREAELDEFDRSRSSPSPKVDAIEAAKAAHLAQLARDKLAAKTAAEEIREPEGDASEVLNPT